MNVPMQQIITRIKSDDKFTEDDVMIFGTKKEIEQIKSMNLYSGTRFK